MHYDVANYTTDRLTAFGGGVATLAYPAGTDGGQTGTGRADQTLAYRNTFGIVQIGGQIQFQNTTNESFVDGYGASLRVTALPGLELGVTATKLQLSDDSINTIRGLDDDPVYVGLGVKFSSDLLELGAVYATQQNGDLTAVPVSESFEPEAEIVPVAFDARGVELYGELKLGSWSILGAFWPTTTRRP